LYGRRRGARGCQTPHIATSDDPISIHTEGRRRARFGAIAGIGVTMVALLVALLFAWPGGEDARRVIDAAGIAQSEVDEPRRATLIDRAVPDTPFARRVGEMGWEPVAIWDQQVRGRETVSVVWEKAGHRVVHSSLGGDPVGRPEGSGRTGRGGVLLYGLPGELRTVVTWTEEGGTAVLSGADLPLGDLYDLAGGSAAPG
jgi:hypothetical protein